MFLSVSFSVSVPYAHVMIALLETSLLVDALKLLQLLLTVTTLTILHWNVWTTENLRW